MAVMSACDQQDYKHLKNNLCIHLDLQSLDGNIHYP